MEVQFIAQGLNNGKSQAAGERLKAALINDSYNKLTAFVAFISSGGINNIKDELIAFKERGCKIHLYLGVDLHGTSKEALQMLIDNAIPANIVYSPNTIVYHPKIYIFEGGQKTLILTGSSNFTTSGLFQNIESSMCIEYENGDDKGNVLLSDIYDYYDDILSGVAPYCQPLTQEILDLLVENKIVLPESQSRIIKNEIEKKATAKIGDKAKVIEKFKKLKISRPPKGYKPTLQEEVVVGDNDSSTVFQSTFDIEAQSMWIETGMMTGASRNILDLSKKGSRDGIRKFGSVEFFGVDANNIAEDKSFEILYNGNIYTNNRIFYAEGNSNWRMQLKGESDDGSKLTDISRPVAGALGGFQDKILIFSKTETANQYKLHIVDKSNRDVLQENSSDWAYGGNGNGRAYGITK
ncbi:MAG: phospholipase D family protein [Bacteroidaceae bacterium]|nr:phospholipase D family protein [Bacteroidaceae bacterium]